MRCPVCGVECDDSAVRCISCGSGLSVSGFGVPPDVGMTQVAGMNQELQTFGVVQSGFGVETQADLFMQAPRQPVGGMFDNPFPQAPETFDTQNTLQLGQQFSNPSSFGMPIDTGFGAPTDTNFGSGFDTAVNFAGASQFMAQQNAMQIQEDPGVNADAARFADTIGQAFKESELDWGFKDCVLMVAKMLIPIYGIILAIQCMMGDQKQFPTLITYFVRASFLVGGIAAVLIFIISLAF